MMAVVSPLWTSEVGKTLMLVFEVRGCLVQCPGKTLLVLAFEALALLISYRPQSSRNIRVPHSLSALNKSQIM